MEEAWIGVIRIQEDIKPLICHIVETCFDVFKTVDYVKTFIGLRTRYDQVWEKFILP